MSGTNHRVMLGSDISTRVTVAEQGVELTRGEVPAGGAWSQHGRALGLSSPRKLDGVTVHVRTLRGTSYVAEVASRRTRGWTGDRHSHGGRGR